MNAWGHKVELYFKKVKFMNLNLLNNIKNVVDVELIEMG